MDTDLLTNNVSEPDYWLIRFPGDTDIKIVFHSAARIKIFKHIYNTPDIETGGVLIGKSVSKFDESKKKEITVIHVTASLPAKQDSQSAIEFNFSPDSWAEINRIIDANFQDSEILGWYHTHPGHRVFLSKKDLFIHNNFFSKKYHLALVVDTFADYGIFYIGNDKFGGPFASEEVFWEVSRIKLIRNPHLFERNINSNLSSNKMNVSDASRIQILESDLIENDRTNRSAEKETPKNTLEFSKFELAIIIFLVITISFILSGIFFIIFGQKLLGWLHF